MYKGYDITNGSIVAVKVLPLASKTRAQLDGIHHEIRLLEVLDHPNIVKYVGHCQDRGQMCIFLEYVWAVVGEDRRG